MNTKEINKEMKMTFKNLKENMNYTGLIKGGLIGFAAGTWSEVAQIATGNKFNPKRLLGTVLASSVGYFVSWNLSYACARTDDQLQEERKQEPENFLKEAVKKAAQDPNVKHFSVDDIDSWIKEDEAAEEANKYKEVL